MALVPHTGPVLTEKDEAAYKRIRQDRYKNYQDSVPYFTLGILKKFSTSTLLCKYLDDDDDDDDDEGTLHFESTILIL